MNTRAAAMTWLYWALGGLLLALLGAVYVLATYDTASQRELAGSTTVWGLHACVATVVAGLLAGGRVLYTVVGRRHLICAGGWLLAGFLVCFLAPRTNRIFFDEHIYMQIGQNIAFKHRADLSLYAKFEHGRFFNEHSIVNKQPNGLPYMLSWLFRGFGANERTAEFVNMLATGVTAATLYLLLALAPWRLPPAAAWLGALLYIFTPLVPWWGHTVAVEPWTAALMAMTLLCALLYGRQVDEVSGQGPWPLALLLAGFTAWATYFRPESLMVYALVTAFLWSVRRDFMRDLSAWGALVLALALALPNILHLWSVRTEDWGAKDGRRFDFAFLERNLESNVGYFFTTQWFPVAGTLLMVVGMGWLLFRRTSAGMALMFWFSLSWGVFVFFYAGGYYYGASSRYAILSVVPVAALAGIGLAFLWDALRTRPVVRGVGLVALLLNWSFAFSYVPYKGEEAFEAMADVDFVREQALRLPVGSLVISQVNSVWNMQGKNSTQYENIRPMLNAELRELSNQYPGGIYLHWSYWENAEADRAFFVAKLLAAMDAQEVARMNCRAHVFALYRLDTPMAVGRFGGEQPLHPVWKSHTLDQVLQEAKSSKQEQLKAGSPPLELP